jgi:hypothetical protein
LNATAVLQQEQAAGPLDPVIRELESILRRLREAMEQGGDPAALEARGAAMGSLADDLMRLPPRLLKESHECTAGAAALRAAETAAGALEDAVEALAAAEAEYAATAEPEQAAARRAVTARQLAERAADALGQAEKDNAEPAALAELHGRARDAATVLERETLRLGEAQQVRQAAKDTLDRDRDSLRKAQDDLAAAETAAANPSPANLSKVELAKLYMFSFSSRPFDGEPLTAEEMAACVWNAEHVCDDLGGDPPGAEIRSRARMSQEIDDATRGGRGYTLQTDRGPVTLRRVRPGDVVVPRANQLATVHQGR